MRAVEVDEVEPFVVCRELWQDDARSTYELSHSGGVYQRDVLVDNPLEAGWHGVRAFVLEAPLECVDARDLRLWQSPQQVDRRESLERAHLESACLATVEDLADRLPPTGMPERP